MNTQEIANRFYELARKGNWEQIQNELFSEEAKSIEPPSSQGLRTVTGLDKIKEKGKQWEGMIEENYGGSCSELLVSANHFTCVMSADVKMKGQDRTKMEEVAVYEVKDGKIISEQFFF